MHIKIIPLGRCAGEEIGAPVVLATAEQNVVAFLKFKLRQVSTSHRLRLRALRAH